jgi:hypothetical protein
LKAKIAEIVWQNAHLPFFQGPLDQVGSKWYFGELIRDCVNPFQWLCDRHQYSLVPASLCDLNALRTQTLAGEA